MKTCSVNGCENLLGNGDELFCVFHREIWRKAVVKLGLQKTGMPPMEEGNLHPYYIYFIKNGEVISILSGVEE